MINASDNVTQDEPVGNDYVDPLHLGIYLTIGILGITGNGFTLIILCSSASMRNKTFNMFLISQSLLDFFCAVILIATSWDVVFEQGGGYFGVAGILKCYLWDSKHQLWNFQMSSTCNLVGLNIERWLSIKYPVFHKTKFTRRHAMMMIVAAWLFGPLFNAARMIPTTRITSDGICIQNLVFPSPFWFSFTVFVTGTIYLFFPLILIACLYSSLFWTLRKKSSSGHLSEGNNNAHANTMDKAKQNILKTVIILTVGLFLCWIWNITFVLIHSIDVALNTTTEFYNFSIFMLNLNCCINPFCYAIQYREFQLQTRRLFCPGTLRKGRKNTLPSISNLSTIESTVT